MPKTRQIDQTWMTMTPKQREKELKRMPILPLDPRAEIKAYWESPRTVSLIDNNLRNLETEFIDSHLSANSVHADLGCGNGESTWVYATKVRSCFALEQSRYLREQARCLFKNMGVSKKVELAEGDVLDLTKYRNRFNTVSTQRVVINFMSWEEQKKVLREIHSTLRPGGLYLAIENTFEGFDALNAWRRKVDLPNIPLHDWHNFFLHRDQFLNFMKDGLFVLEDECTFNLYYMLTRVFENMFAKFEGFGASAKKDAVFTEADLAAKKLHSLFGDKVHIDVPKGVSFGPIQGFVFRKI